MSDYALPHADQHRTWPAPGCRILRDGDEVLTGRPAAIPRKSTPPSPEKAAEFKRACRELKAEAAYAFAIGLSATPLYVWYLYRSTF